MLKRAISGLALLGLVAACGGESLEGAGSQLAKDGEAVLAWEEWTKAQVTQKADRDIPCSISIGGSYRSFTATAELPNDNPDVDKKLDIAERSVESLFSKLGYEPPDYSDPTDETDSRSLLHVRQPQGNAPELTFDYTMTLPNPKVIAVEIEGESPCL